MTSVELDKVVDKVKIDPEEAKEAKKKGRKR